MEMNESSIMSYKGKTTGIFEMGNFFLPEAIKERMQDLWDLANTYPDAIPVIECAKFLHMSDEGLRRAILQKNIPGAIFWKQAGKENYAYKIETLPFFLWQAQINSMRKEAA